MDIIQKQILALIETLFYSHFLLDTHLLSPQVSLLFILLNKSCFKCIKFTYFCYSISKLRQYLNTLVQTMNLKWLLIFSNEFRITYISKMLYKLFFLIKLYKPLICNRTKLLQEARRSLKSSEISCEFFFIFIIKTEIECNI